MKVTKERLQEILNYNKVTGIFTWKVKKAQNIQIGDDAGSLNSKGYVNIIVDGTNYAAHRLAWLWITGSIPKDQIDHINRIRNDNRAVNLREANNKQNQENVNIRKDNTSGMVGVTWSKEQNKWTVRIQHDKCRIFIGRFDSLDEAITARKQAELSYYTYKEI